MRHLVVVLLMAASGVGPAWAQGRDEPQRLKIDFAQLVQAAPPPSSSAQLHPTAKGAVVGAVIGAGSYAALGLWYCTIGPNEVGECEAGRWVKPVVISAAIGAGIGALIAAIR